jgi:hypothetical protein
VPVVPVAFSSMPTIAFAKLRSLSFILNTDKRRHEMREMPSVSDPKYKQTVNFQHAHTIGHQLECAGQAVTHPPW